MSTQRTAAINLYMSCRDAFTVVGHFAAVAPNEEEIAQFLAGQEFFTAIGFTAESPGDGPKWHEGPYHIGRDGFVLKQGKLKPDVTKIDIPTGRALRLRILRSAGIHI